MIWEKPVEKLPSCRSLPSLVLQISNCINKYVRSAPAHVFVVFSGTFIAMFPRLSSFFFVYFTTAREYGSPVHTSGSIVCVRSARERNVYLAGVAMKKRSASFHSPASPCRLPALSVSDCNIYAIGVGTDSFLSFFFVALRFLLLCVCARRALNVSYH